MYTRLFLALGLLVASMANATPIPSSNDLWQGATILDSSPLLVGSPTPIVNFDARDIFGGTYSINPVGDNPGWTIFTDSGTAGTIHWVEWTMGSQITIDRVDFYATGDINPPAIFPDYRSTSQFRLFADGTKLIDSAVTQPSADWVYYSIPLAAVTATNFRAEFVQGGLGGPRIIELDAFHAPEPGTFLLMGFGLFGSALLYRRRRA